MQAGNLTALKILWGLQTERKLGPALVIGGGSGVFHHMCKWVATGICGLQAHTLVLHFYMRREDEMQSGCHYLLFFWYLLHYCSELAAHLPARLAILKVWPQDQLLLCP